MEHLFESGFENMSTADRIIMLKNEILKLQMASTALEKETYGTGLNTSNKPLYLANGSEIHEMNCTTGWLSDLVRSYERLPQKLTEAECRIMALKRGGSAEVRKWQAERKANSGLSRK